MILKSTAAALCVAVMLGVSAFAAPETISVEYEGAASLITVTNPDASKEKVSVEDREFYFSGYGKEGTRVYFYIYDTEGGSYRPIYSEEGHIYCEIGASKIFVGKVALNLGHNQFLLYAEDADGSVQTYKRDIFCGPSALKQAIDDVFKVFKLLPF